MHLHWKALYNISAAPHQPRLDWQMWFAALGSYEHNPWLVHLVYKLLIGQKEGQLIAREKLIFVFLTALTALWNS